METSISYLGMICYILITNLCYSYSYDLAESIFSMLPNNNVFLDRGQQVIRSWLII